MKHPRNRSPWADSLPAGPASPEARTAVADRHPPAPSASGASERRSVGASERRSVGAANCGDSGAGKSEAKLRARGKRVGRMSGRWLARAGGLGGTRPVAERHSSGRVGVPPAVFRVPRNTSEHRKTFVRRATFAGCRAGRAARRAGRPPYPRPAVRLIARLGSHPTPHLSL